VRLRPFSFTCAITLVVATVTLAFTSAKAQTAHGHWLYDPKGIATPGFVYDVPPAGFDPLTASDIELQQWGFPPRPKSGDPVDYARWKRMATSTRITPQLKFTNIYHGPARNPKIGSAVSNATAATSENWSGYVVTEADGTFSGNNPMSYGIWTVPAVAPGSGSCSSATYASSQWVGFDGWTSSDVLQAGTEANCGNSDYFWYEWYPNAETELSLPVGPGDFVTVRVYYCGSCSPQGSANLENNVTNQTTSIGFNPPSGTTYEGNSAEWIMERPTVDGALADLPNYATMYFSAFAEVGTGNYYEPGYVPTGTILQVSMTCPPWNPSSACNTKYPLISIAYAAIGTDTFYVSAANAAQ
jgi:peptidase A4-like protein